MSSEAKRAIGVRANDFLSQAALDELTEAGRKLPLNAHEITLLRAHVTVGRAQSIVQALDAGLEIRIDGSFADRCPVCKATLGTTLAPDAVDPFPPKDCLQDGCAIHLVPWKDYFAGFDKSEVP
jgi:hypothetical protein